jgi:hypothetical protein
MAARAVGIWCGVVCHTAGRFSSGLLWAYRVLYDTLHIQIAVVVVVLCVCVCVCVCVWVGESD